MRICWLLNCWWAFGSSDGGEADERDCLATYELLGSMLAATCDAAVRLQAASTLLSLLRCAGDDDLRVFAVAAPAVSTGLAAALGSCSSDEALFWILATLRQVLRAPAPLHPSLPPVLEALWARACVERHELLKLELQGIAALSGL